MKSRILHLPIICVESGMTLALAVVDRAGRTLCAAGTVLDTEMLSRLNKRGIESIAVSVIDTRTPEIIAEEIQNAEVRVTHIFRGTGSPARDALQAAILAYRREIAR